MRCNAARDAEIQQEVNALRDHVSNLEARLAQGGSTGQLAESNLHAEHERRRTEGAQQQEEARKRDLKRQEEERLRDESMKRDIGRQKEERKEEAQFRLNRVKLFVEEEARFRLNRFNLEPPPRKQDGSDMCSVSFHVLPQNARAVCGNMRRAQTIPGVKLIDVGINTMTVYADKLEQAEAARDILDVKVERVEVAANEVVSDRVAVAA
jgi:hypothetical protein